MQYPSTALCYSLRTALSAGAFADAARRSPRTHPSRTGRGSHQYGEQFLGGCFFGGILDGIHAAAREHGRQLIVVRGTALEHHTHLAWDQGEGWIVVQVLDGIGELAARGFPAVTISAQAAGLDYPTIMPDNYRSTFAATQHLLDHGHQRIAFVGPLPSIDVEERLAGYRDALQAREITPDPALVLDPGFAQPWCGQRTAALATVPRPLRLAPTLLRRELDDLAAAREVSTAVE